MKRTGEEIQSEIDGLQRVKPRVRQRNFFGDNNHAAIEAQITVLTNRLSDDQIYDRADSWEDNVRDAALEARDWLDGNPDIPSLVATWEELAS